tara:strand:+ start:179 stop:1261 length:1083 start_codon:yes stop_codon:yes gene_type:complete
MIEILNKNFGFKKVKDPFDNDAIEMSARDAFRYSLLEGAPYLSQEYGYTCKEQMRVFYGRASLNDGFVYYTPGLFGVKRIDDKIHLDEGNSPFYLDKKFPKMFQGKKTVIFHKVTGIESLTEIESKIYKKIIEKGKDPDDFLLTLVDSGDKRKENFLEFVASQYFNQQGYLTESQVPFANTQGVPDFGAYQSPLIDILIDEKFIEKACPLVEISAACVFQNNGSPTNQAVDYAMLIGEAKTNSDALKQLNTHKELKLATYLFEIYANQTKTSDFGLLKFNDDFTINFDKSPEQTVDQSLLKKDEKFFENYLKFYIVANLPLEKIKQKFVKSKQERETEQLIKNVMKEGFSDIVKFVKGEI